MTEKPKKFYWHAKTSSGGTLSLRLNFEEDVKKKIKESVLADVLVQSIKFMEESGYIPYDAELMSSRDIAQTYGKTRQYWEKLLNEGKILYKETSAGRVTTNLWVNGYLGNKPNVDKYVKDVKKAINSISQTKKHSDKIICPVCDANELNFFVNQGGSTNGICHSCGFHIYTTS